MSKFIEMRCYNCGYVLGKVKCEAPVKYGISNGVEETNNYIIQVDDYVRSLDSLKSGVVTKHNYKLYCSSCAIIEEERCHDH